MTRYNSLPHLPTPEPARTRTVCPDAGPLGASIRHPGPIVSYTWAAYGGHEYIFPPWLIEMVEREDLTVHHVLAQAMLKSIRETAKPYRFDFDDPEAFREDWHHDYS